MYLFCVYVCAQFPIWISLKVEQELKDICEVQSPLSGLRLNLKNYTHLTSIGHSWLQLQPERYRTVNSAGQHQVCYFCGVFVTVKSLVFSALNDSSDAREDQNCRYERETIFLDYGHDSVSHPLLCLLSLSRDFVPSFGATLGQFFFLNMRIICSSNICWNSFVKLSEYSILGRCKMLEVAL